MALCDRNRQVVLREDSANVSRHVVRPLVVVFKPRRAVRYQTNHEAFQILAYRWVGILAEDQRCAGMMDEYVSQPSMNLRAAHDIAYAVGDCVSTASVSDNGKRLLCDHKNL